MGSCSRTPTACSCATSSSGGPSRPTCCRPRGSATTPRSPRPSPTSRSWRCAITRSRSIRPRRDSAAIAAADLAAAVDCAGRRAGRARARDLGRRDRRSRGRRARASRPGARPDPRRRPPRPRPRSAPISAIRAAEAAFAADRPVRAAAYLDATIGAADARQDRTRLGLIYDRLGQFRRVAGDAEGARRRATTGRRAGADRRHRSARAAVVAGLAQLRMLEGTFSVAEKLARDAIRIARGMRPAGRRLGAARHDDARRVARLAGRSRRGRGDADRRPADGRGARRPRRAVPRLRQPDDGPGPRRAGTRKPSRSPSRASPPPDRPGWRPSTATSCAATPPTRCSSSAAGTRRGP